jgi:hypothetical protein
MQSRERERFACRLCVLSAKDARPNQDSPSAGFALPLSNQQVADSSGRPLKCTGNDPGWLRKEEDKVKRIIVCRDFVFRL